jgi:hypothetical protein
MSPTSRRSVASAGSRNDFARASLPGNATLGRGDPHPDLASTLQSIAVIHLKRGDAEDAPRYLRSSVASGLEPAERAALATDDDWKAAAGK